MKKLLLHLIFYAPLLNFNSFCFAQNKNIDSLAALIETDKPDTNKVNHLNKISREYINIGDYANGLKYGNKALALANSLPFGNRRGWAKGTANSYNTIGTIYLSQGNYSQALKNYRISLKIREDIKDKKGIAISYNNIGIVNMHQGNDPEALKNYYASLKIREELGDKQDIAASYNNIGLLFTHQFNYSEALKNDSVSLKIYEDIKDKHNIALSHNNIGIILELQRNFQEALKNYLCALKIFEETGDKHSIASSYGNIGNLYKNEGNYQEEQKNYLAALKIQKEIGDKKGIANSLLILGIVELKLHKLKTAENYLNSALLISNEIGDLENIKNSHSGLNELYRSKGQWKDAYMHREISNAIKDSMDNIESKKKIIESTITNKFEKQEIDAKHEQDKKDAVTEAESKKQKIIILSVAIGLLIVLVSAVFILRSLRITRRQKNIIELQKNEVSKQKDISDTLRIIAEKQKHIVEEKQKEILDSITYARRIQRALLTSDEYIKNNLPAEHFILFKPKDIVSGDFYWALRNPPLSGETSRGLFYIAAADCTGHGVPGAFMSMLNISYFNENVIERSIRMPHDILNAQRTEIIKALNPPGSTEVSKDGMDCILCVYDFDKMLLHFAAANNPLWLVRNSELIEYKGDKMPVGKYTEEMLPFTLQTIELQKGDIIYTSTDGFADQFGTNGKKMMKKTFKEELLKIHQSPMKEQKEYLNNFFESWKGNTEQVDDVCIIGVKI